MIKYLILIMLFGVFSCSGKQKKMRYIFWKTKSGLISDVRYKMEVSGEIVDGNCWHYYQNGQLLSKARYEENKLMEIYEVYDTLGNPLNYGQLKYGNGYVTSYDDQNGVRKFSGRYKDGLRTGWWKNYDFRGEVTDSVLFKDGFGDGYKFYLYLLY